MKFQLFVLSLSLLLLFILKFGKTPKFRLYACVIRNENVWPRKLKAISSYYDTFEQCQTAVVLLDKQIIREISLGRLPASIFLECEVWRNSVMLRHKRGYPGTFVNFD